jgi:hypothetical protein
MAQTACGGVINGMAKKKNIIQRSCTNCIHEFACRMWTDGRIISDDSASRCPNYTEVKDSPAYLCGVLDERKRMTSDEPDPALLAYLIRGARNKMKKRQFKSNLESDFFVAEHLIDHGVTIQNKQRE